MYKCQNIYIKNKTFIYPQVYFGQSVFEVLEKPKYNSE